MQFFFLPFRVAFSNKEQPTKNNKQQQQKYRREHKNENYYE